MDTHPLLTESQRIAWSKITPSLMREGVETALKTSQARLDAIAEQPLTRATFANTILALEESTKVLGRAWSLVSHLKSVMDAPELREVYTELLPKISEFYAAISLNPKIWAQVKAFAQTPEAAGLSGLDKRLFDETRLNFVQAGADLPEEKRGEFLALEQQLATVCQRYSENVLDSTNAWELIVEDAARLRGLPERAIDSARRSALAKGHGSEAQPKWRFTLHQPSMEPVMLFAEDETLRREVWEASTRVGADGKWDNTENVREILRLRRAKAELLGQKDFPDYVLQRRMAKTGAAALNFVEDMAARARPAFERESAELETFKAEKTGKPLGRLAPWEVAYWAEKLRSERFAFDEEAVRPFFPMERVIAGMFEICRRIFGIRVRELSSSEAEVWHSDVRAYELADERSGAVLGLFFSDWYPRESKQGGAWMDGLLYGEPQSSGAVPHVGVICGNMTPPSADKPALLSHREVETVFHEFGHLLHHLLSEVRYPSIGGTSVAWDFVELPSQIMENWCWEREALDLFARHHKTGAAIPDDLFEKMKAARTFRSATATMRQMAFAKMDLAMHLEPEAFLSRDFDAELRKRLLGYLTPLQPEPPTIVRRFTHLFGGPTGYASGYYSYKWAEVLDADAFTRFQKEGVFNASVGAEFRREILSAGNAADPMSLFVRFMGRQPDPQALLVRSGLAA